MVWSNLEELGLEQLVGQLLSLQRLFDVLGVQTNGVLSQVSGYSGAAKVAKPGIQSLQKPAVPRNSHTYRGVLGTGMVITVFFLTSVSHLFLSFRIYPRQVTSVRHSCTFFADTRYPNSPISLRSLLVRFNFCKLLWCLR